MAGRGDHSNTWGGCTALFVAHLPKRLAPLAVYNPRQGHLQKKTSLQKEFVTPVLSSM